MGLYIYVCGVRYITELNMLWERVSFYTCFHRTSTQENSTFLHWVHIESNVNKAYIYLISFLWTHFSPFDWHNAYFRKCTHFIRGLGYHADMWYLNSFTMAYIFRHYVKWTCLMVRFCLNPVSKWRLASLNAVLDISWRPPTMKQSFMATVDNPSDSSFFRGRN